MSRTLFIVALLFLLPSISHAVFVPVETFDFNTYSTADLNSQFGWSAPSTVDVVASSCFTTKCVRTTTSGSTISTNNLPHNLASNYSVVTISAKMKWEKTTGSNTQSFVLGVANSNIGGNDICAAGFRQSSPSINQPKWSIHSSLVAGTNSATLDFTQADLVWNDILIEIDFASGVCGIWVNGNFVASVLLGYSPSSYLLGTDTFYISTGNAGTGKQKYVDTITILGDDGTAPPLPDVLFGGYGTTTQIIKLNAPANNMQGATSSVHMSFDYMVGSDVIPSHAGVEVVRYLPNGFTYAPIEETVVASGLSTFSESFEPDFNWSPYNQFFRWRAYLRDSNNNRLANSEWRYFTTSTTTPVADPNSTPAWEVWYDYGSSTIDSNTGYINDAYDRCDSFDDNIGNDLFAKPLCRLIVFLFVPVNSYTLGDELLAEAKARVPFSYVAAVTDTVTAARSEYYTDEATFPEFVLDTGTSSAIDIQIVVLSKSSIESIVGTDVIPQFRVIIQYFLWILFMTYAFFVALREVQRLTK